MNTMLHNPPTMQWEVTAECNHDCIHCYNYWRKDFEKLEGHSRIKSEEEYLSIAKKIIELNPVAVTITGGEPMIVFDRIRSSISLLAEQGIVITINTNAALLTDEICAFLKEKGVGLFVSFISAVPSVFDSIVNRGGAFEKVIKGLDLAKSYKIPFTNNIVVSTENIWTLALTVDYLKERYNPKYISVTRVGKPINSDDTFNDKLLDRRSFGALLDTIVDLTKKHPDLTIGTACPYTPCSLYSQEAFEIYGYQKVCTAGKTSFSIDTDGNFKACPRDSRMYGNIHEISFDEAYRRMHEWRDGSFVPDECKGCKEYPRCLGGCRVDSIPFTGKSNCLDRISNPENLPLKYHKKPKDHDHTGVSFKLNDGIKYLENDENTFRVSHGRHFMFITRKLCDFLIGNESFMSKDLAKYFDKETGMTDMVISRLLAEEIIVRA